MKKNLQEQIEKILNPEKIEKLRKDFKKTKNKFAARIIQKGNEFVIVDFSEEISNNDIITFNENGGLVKAVVTGKGKHGVVARDKNQNKVKIRYRDILNFKKRETKNA